MLQSSFCTASLNPVTCHLLVMSQTSACSLTLTSISFPYSDQQSSTAKSWNCWGERVFGNCMKTTWRLSSLLMEKIIPCSESKHLVTTERRVDITLTHKSAWMWGATACLVWQTHAYLGFQCSTWIETKKQFQNTMAGINLPFCLQLQQTRETLVSEYHPLLLRKHYHHKTIDISWRVLLLIP